jgi:prepilin-type N-terminal cleavage/methylation domain-containing protein
VIAFHAPPRSPRGDRRGVTAVELVIVLAVVAILGMAYPLLSNLSQVLMVKGAAEQTASAVRLARQLAITQGSNRCIEFGPSGPPASQYRIREADTTPSCGGAVVPGYDWQNLSESGTVGTTAPTLIFDPIGNRILPAGPGSTTFNVDTVPASCLSVITVTLYGGVRVAGC